MSASTITILFLIFAIVSFILEKIPLGLTATIVAIGLNVTGVLDASQTFSGYVNSNVILCVGMFVVGQALFETGMANKIGGVVTRFAKNEKILMVAIMVIVGVMSGFLSNTGTAAVLIPVVCGIADESGYSRSRLLMPLVFAAALGGNLSIIGAPGNLMGVDALQNLGEETGFLCMRRLESQCFWQVSFILFSSDTACFRRLLQKVWQKWQRQNRISVMCQSGNRLRLW
ncbi:MAG: SLC13 family permease [Eubacterium sp.]